ncbi:MAG TPA: DEAD/DEAH box helicase [Solirubrobacteraceae bacterium]|nr:DEAD/DEAH box helicase [Solirubrobacteraceae bacterium]
MSTKSFADLGVSRPVVDVLSSRGITAPFPVQSLVVNDVLEGRDVLVKSPTGSGKTLAFGIPIVERLRAEGPRPAALVLAPTRELASQIVEEIREIAHARALRVTAVYGGVGLTKQAQSAAKSHIVVATPGRLEDLLDRKAFSLSGVRMLVLDEADRMLDMGFRPAVDRIVQACPRERQTLFFSATLEGAVGKIAAQYTHDAIAHEHGPSGDHAAADVEHRFVRVADDRVGALVDELSQERDLALVFVRTKRGADRLVKRLASSGVKAAAVHGNRSQKQREQALSQFRSGHVDTLVATDVAARGIDVQDISHVINFDLPGDHDVYVHRVGRTGRAGRRGIGITLVGAGDRNDARQIADRLNIEHGLGGGAPRGNGGSNGGNRAGSSSRNGSGSRNGGSRNGSGSRGASSSRNGSGAQNGGNGRNSRRRGSSDSRGSGGSRAARV